MKKNTFTMLAFTLSSLLWGAFAHADILTASDRIAAELQCATQRVGDEHFMIKVAAKRTEGVVDSCSGESCKTVRKINLREATEAPTGLSLSSTWIQVICADCNSRGLLGLIELPSNTLSSSGTRAGSYYVMTSRGLEKKYRVNCRISPVRDSRVHEPAESTSENMPSAWNSLFGGSSTRVSWMDSAFGQSPSYNYQHGHQQEKPKAAPKRRTVRPQPAPKPRARPTPRPATPVGESSDMVVCPDSKGLNVRNSRLTSVIFDAFKGETVIVKSASGSKDRVLRGERHNYIHVEFPRLNRDGWVARQYVMTRAQCYSGGRPTERPAEEPQPTPAPKKPSKTPPRAEPPSQQKVDSSSDLLAPNCARTTLIRAAKTAVARHWKNRPYSAGQCALGVRQALQLSGVGGVQGGIGHAADYVHNLKKYGYVDTGIRDLRQAPAGAVVVFSGPYTNQYFRTRKMSRPYGNYVGHVAIKGDDGFYYTDGRTDEPSIGWQNERNVRKVRNVIGVFVPGTKLVREFSGKCRGMN